MSNSSYLTVNMRQTLYSLKAVKNNISRTSLALNTGKKVNSASDNLSVYIRSSYLTYRANELSRLLDTATQAGSALKTATEALSSITSMLQEAKSFAELAEGMDVAASSLTSDVTFTGESQVITDIPSVNAGDIIKIKPTEAKSIATKDKNYTGEQTVASAGITTADPLYLKVGSENWVTVTPLSDSMSMSQFLKQIEDTIGADKVSAKLVDGNISITTQSAATILIDDNPYGALPPAPSTATKLGFNTGNNIEITAGMTLADLMTEIDNIEGMKASLSGNTLTIKNTYGEDLTIADLKGNSASTLDIAGTSTKGSSSNASYAEKYNNLLKQIDSLANDSYYNGINLLSDQTYTIYFDENRENKLTLIGVEADSNALGLTPAENEWKDMASVRKSLEQINAAISKASQYATTFSYNLHSLTSRSEYIDSIIDLMGTEVNDMTKADDATEAANLLALQTQKELCTNALSLSSEINQAVLKLFA